MRTIIKLLNNNFSLLDKKRDRVFLISVCFIFSVLFINIFVPFNINRWFSDSGFIKILRLSSYGLIIALVLLFTQFPLRKLFKVQHFKFSTYFLWLFVEIVIISLVYIFLYGNPLGNLVNDFIFSLKYTLLGICLPYSFALLLIYYKNQRAEIAILKGYIGKQPGSHLTGFRDDKGKIQFSVLTGDILFLESTDNYISVFYLLNGKIQRKLLRNTLKNMEEELKMQSVIRCHRSFMINTQNIEFAQKKGKFLQLKIKHYESYISVSQKYLSLFLGFLS